MKKLTLTIAIVLGMTVGAMAQQNELDQQNEMAQQNETSQQDEKEQQHAGGLFERGYVSDEAYYGSNSHYDGYFSNLRNQMLMNLPDHGQDDNQDATPLGSGIAVLLGLGGAYLVAKRRKEE